MARITRIGDAHSHGGVVITGNGQVLVEGPPSSRIGDLAICPLHGVVVIVTGSVPTFNNATNYSRVGSLLSCGAIMVTGASKTEVS